MSPARSLFMFLPLAALALASPTSKDVPEECKRKPSESPKERAACCEMPMIISKENDKFKNVFSECHGILMAAPAEEKLPLSTLAPATTAASSPTPTTHHRHDLPCMDECLFNKTGLVTEDMKLDRNAISKLVAEVLKADDGWKPVGEEAVKTCTEVGETAVDKGGCNGAPRAFMKCLAKEMFVNCPQSSWKETDECKAEKDLMMKCSNLMPKGTSPANYES